MTIISTFIGGLTYVVIGLRAFKGYISLGNVSQGYSSIVILISSIQNLFVSISQIISNNEYLKVLYEYIDLAGVSSQGKIIPKEQSSWTIEFHNVSFKYPSAEEYALKNVSFKITSNSQTAVVGVNGSGKTTMIKLLCGFYKPQEGYITLNGIKIQDYDRSLGIRLRCLFLIDFHPADSVKKFLFLIRERLSRKELMTSFYKIETESILNCGTLRHDTINNVIKSI